MSDAAHPQDHEELPVKKANLKVLFIGLGALTVLIAGTFWMRSMKAAKRAKKDMSIEETQVQAQGDKVARNATKESERTKPSEFGKHLQFDSQGNLVGAEVGKSSDVPDNRTMGQVEDKAKEQQALKADENDRLAIEREVDKPTVRRGLGEPRSRDRESNDPQVMEQKQRQVKEKEQNLSKPLLGYSLNPRATSGRLYDGKGEWREGGEKGASRGGNPNIPDPSSPESEDPSIRAMRNQLGDLQKVAMGQMSAAAGQGSSTGAGPVSGGGPRSTFASTPGAVADMRTGHGSEDLIHEGKYLDCVLTNRIEASYNDSPVVAMVNRDFLSRDGKHVLFPAGTKLIGVAGKVDNWRQERMFISFHRAIFPGPEQRSAWFPERTMPEGMMSDGSAGVAGKINRHFWKMYGAALLFGAIDGFAAYQAGPVSISPFGAETLTPQQSAVAAASKQFNKVTDRILASYGNMVPTIALPAGTRMKVYFSTDTKVTAFMPSSELAWVRSQAVVRR